MYSKSFFIRKKHIRLQKINYKCTQQELYAVCKLAWTGCQEHIERFADFNPKYSMALITARKKEIEETSVLADDAMDLSTREALRLQLRNASRQGLHLWQKLRYYIEEAYPENLQLSKLKQAGQNDYGKASALNWEACKVIISCGVAFIKTESEALVANENMPIGFSAEFIAARKIFEDVYLQYIKSTGQRTHEKIKANNHLFEALMGMLLDANEIFKTEPSIQKQFIFDQLRTVASG